MAVKTDICPFLLKPDALSGAYVEGSAEIYLIREELVLSGSNKDNAIARKGFLEQEVELLWATRNEILAPNETEEQVVYVGRWKNHSPDLLVRISGKGIALARQIRTGLLGDEEQRWFCAWYGEKKDAFVTQGALPLKELVKAAGLATEFVESVEKYLPQYL